MSTQVKPNVDLTIDRDFSSRDYTIAIPGAETSSGLSDLIDKPDSRKKNNPNLDIFDTLDEFRGYIYESPDSWYDEYSTISYTNDSFSITNNFPTSKAFTIQDDWWDGTSFTKYDIDYIMQYLDKSNIWTVSQYEIDKKDSIESLKDPKPKEHKSPAMLLEYLGLDDKHVYDTFDYDYRRPVNLEDVLYELGDSDESYDYFENALVDLMGRSNNTTGIFRIVQNLYIPGR